MSVNKLLVVLGSPNSSTGKLSPISIERLEHCLKLYHNHKCLILCTGGWGAHFNTAKQAHAAYAKKFLIQHGVSEAAIMDLALSQNTVEDAVMVKEIISSTSFKSITVITSDYHKTRVRLIFDQILSDQNLSYVGTISKLPKQELEKLKEHEKNAINRIRENGLYY